MRGRLLWQIHLELGRLGSAVGRPCLLSLFLLAPASSAADLRGEVSRLSANDQRQDIRLHNLERDVDYLQRKSQYSPKGPSHYAATSGKSPVSSVTTSAKAPVSPAPETTYKVRQGDSLWRIAMNHRVSPGEIMQLNGLRSDTVQTGQTLRIPARGGVPESPSVLGGKPAASKTSSAGGGSHVIAQGDTFSGIAQRYGVTQSALQQANPGVNPNVILIGSKLVIPAGGKAATSVNAAATTPPPASSVVAGTADPGRRHTVKPNETLTSIAVQHGVTAAAIQHSNQMSDPNKLSVGQQLVIPASGSKPANIVRSTPGTEMMTAAPAAALSTVSPTPAYPGAGSGLQPTADAAKLTTPAASPGPLPQDNPRGVLIYRVHSTDTIESIAATFGTTPQKIRELNRKPANSGVAANEEILVPAMGAVGL